MNAQTSMITFSETEKAVLMGSLLGDSTLQKRGENSFRYQVAHGIQQREYVMWKYSKLSRLCQTTQPPREITNRRGQVSCEFYTSSGLYLKDLYDLFYKQDLQNRNRFIKTITPELILQLPMNPIVLAVLFMDDGSVRNDCYAGKIATQCFSLEENNLLKDYLKKWGVDINIVRHTQASGQYYISIPSRSFPKLVEIIEPTVREVPVMVYKLNEVNRASRLTP